MKAEKPNKGEPKWDFIASVKIPLNFRNIRFGSLKVGKSLLRKLKTKL